MRIEQLAALTDNFIYLLIDDEKQEAAVVDPPEAKKVIHFLEKNNLTLTKIFNTHHHFDHVGGNKELIQKYPQAEVYAGIHDKGRIPLQKHFLNHNDIVSFANEKASVYYVPGHTLGHIAYHFKLKNSPDCLFIGDTIFSGGCGRLFEGTFLQMFTSLKFLRDHLSDDTLIFCAHEYTVENYSVLAKLEPNNIQIQEKLERSIHTRQQNLFTVPFTLGEEKQCSSFLRWDDPELKKITGTASDLETFTYVRKHRNNALIGLRLAGHIAKNYKFLVRCLIPKWPTFRS
jgi:hydroxyacylglutathione hydrolase